MLKLLISVKHTCRVLQNYAAKAVPHQKTEDRRQGTTGLARLCRVFLLFYRFRAGHEYDETGWQASAICYPTDDFRQLCLADSDISKLSLDYDIDFGDETHRLCTVILNIMTVPNYEYTQSVLQH